MYKFKDSLIARHRGWMALSALLVAAAILSLGAKLMKAQETGPPLGQTRVINFGLVTVARNQFVRLNALKIPSHGDVKVNLKIRVLLDRGRLLLEPSTLTEKDYLLNKDFYFANTVETDFPPDHPDRGSIAIFATATISGGDAVDRTRVITTLEVIDKDTGRTSLLYPAPPPCDSSAEPCNDSNDVNH
jgi:hypothetical protein